MRSWNTTALIIALTLMLAVTMAAAQPPTISNPAQPANGLEQMHLEEQWRVGGPDDEENFFGLITWAEADDDGLLYVLDAQMCQVLVYNQEGQLVKTLFGQGEGPGEVRQPRDLLLLPDGTVGAVQEFPGKIIRVDKEGNPAGDITPGNGDPSAGGFMALVAAEHRGGTFMLSGVSISPGERQGIQERTMFLATANDDGVLQKRFLEKTATPTASTFMGPTATLSWSSNATMNPGLAPVRKGPG